MSRRWVVAGVAAAGLALAAAGTVGVALASGGDRGGGVDAVSATASGDITDIDTDIDVVQQRLVAEIDRATRLRVEPSIGEVADRVGAAADPNDLADPADPADPAEPAEPVIESSFGSIGPFDPPVDPPVDPPFDLLARPGDTPADSPIDDGLPAPTCDHDGRSVVVDRDHQRAWFCDASEVTHRFPVSTAVSQPDPGVYEVYAKDLDAWSEFGDAPSTMTHFVAFTRGKYLGARIAFHSVPKYRDGSWVQPLDTVGSPERHGDSSGCIRVLPDDAEAIWDWLDLGGTVVVVS